MLNDQEKNKKLYTRVFIIFFITIFAVNLLLLLPLFDAIAFAAIISSSFYPLYERLKARLQNDMLASLLTTLIIFLCFLLPLVFMGFQLTREMINLLTDLKKELTRDELNQFLFGDGLVANAVTYLNNSFDLSIDLTKLQSEFISFAESFTKKVLATLNGWVSGTLNFVFQFFMMVVASYAFFIQGENLKKFIFALNPLPDDQEQMILDRFSQMNDATLVCNGIGGVVQGSLAGIGLWMCGIESVFLWTILMIVLAFIPLFGISIVTIPATIYLFVVGKQAEAISFIVITTAIALYVENIFKPKFIGKKIKINSILLLFYIIAGMATFGMAGIFYGPILCTLFLTMVDLLHKHYLPNKTDESPQTLKE
jgi:predicted PurR-regulated permease PerM